MIDSIINKSLLFLLCFALIFSILLLSSLNFEFIDEVCALTLSLIFVGWMFHTPDWRINKVFGFLLLVFFFYLGYSFLIHSNTKSAVISDFLVQIKPYLAFFCIYNMLPVFDLKIKTILKYVSLFVWGVLLLFGLLEVFGLISIWDTMGHPAFYAGAVIITAFCYYFCCDNTRWNRVFFFIMLSIGVLSGRSKFYGFFALTLCFMLYLSLVKNFKFSAKTIFVVLSVVLVMFVVAYEKIDYYFLQAISGEIDKDMVARYVLYANAPLIMLDYFPFGSGFASYGTFFSGLHYSHIYEKYGIDGVWGISKDYYSFIADTFYPSLAQVGIVGFILYIWFWSYLLKKSYKLYRLTNDKKNFFLIVSIIAYLFIEGIAASTFTMSGGFFIMMLLGLSFSEMKSKSIKLLVNE